MKKKVEIAEDAETIEMIAAYKRGEFKPVGNQKAAKAQLQAAAANYLRKNARINIRLTQGDLLRLKQRAAEEGMPYQTLIASVLHKFVMGRL